MSYPFGYGLSYTSFSYSDLQLTNMTIEVIYRPIQTFCDTLNFSPLVTLKDAPTSEGITFGFGWTGKLSARFAVQAIGSSTKGSTSFQATKVVPSDNAKWHHAAFTFDAAGIARALAGGIEAAEGRLKALITQDADR